MKSLIVISVLALGILSCQSDKGRQSTELREMAEQNLEYVRAYGNDAHAKMILKYGQEKVAWFDSAMNATSKEFDMRDSIEQAKIDSVNALLKKDSAK